jgi:translation initiation factor IF-2
MAKARKPFVSRKRRKEMMESRERRENLIALQQEQRRANESTLVSDVKKDVALPQTATVGEFAQKLNLPVVRVISSLMRNGIMAAINDRIDFDTMGIIADELGFIAQPAGESAVVTDDTETEEAAETSVSVGEIRPPVVTIMGHVDHGKTTLLDTIRKANVAASEVGGITQHIGAYQVSIPYEGQDRLITFLDTPGHEAFTALRSHGAQVTDIVVLVVAADDGMKPQTIEAIDHAKQARVPIIVAVTKTDVPGANIERVKQQITEHDLIPEEWGGSTIVAPVSALKGEGITELLEFILLTADLKAYKADPSAPAQGVVIESHVETGLGPVATLLVQNGTVRLGDVIVLSQAYGKIRSMETYRGEKIKEATPSTPIRISGITAVPQFGESFAAVKNEKEARAILERATGASHQRRAGDLSRAIAEGRTNTLNIVLKADAQGSLEALRASIAKLHEPGVKPMIVHGSIGDVSLSDVQLAAASNAIIFGFHVVVNPATKKAADNYGITISTHKIIYDLLDEIEQILKGRVRTEMVAIERGRLKVKKIFRTTREEQIVGGEITQGDAINKAFVTIMRDGEEIGRGKLTSLKKGPEAVERLEAGQDCGVAVQTTTKIAEGDMLVFAIEEEKIVTDTSEAAES